MNVHKSFLLAVASAAAFAAAPITAQEILPRPEAPEYALHIDATAERIAFRGGMPGIPVALMVGLEETHFMLPNNALLRVNPIAIFVVGEFDDAGEYEWRMSEYKGEPVTPFLEAYVQALSVAGVWDKLCTSELLRIETDLCAHWIFEYLG